MTATCAAWFVLSVAAFYNTRLRISYALVTAGPLPLALSLSAVLLGAFVNTQLLVVAFGAFVAAVRGCGKLNRFTPASVSLINVSSVVVCAVVKIKERSIVLGRFPRFLIFAGPASIAERIMFCPMDSLKPF